ncbi:hypothetical protein D3C86_1037490 [compost metagenome]
MARRLVDDVGRRGVGEMLERSHVRGDGQDPVRLEVHEGRRGDEAPHVDGTPAELGQALILVRGPGDRLHLDPRRAEPPEVGGIGAIREEGDVLPHDVAPHRLIDRGVGVVVLRDHQRAKLTGDLILHGRYLNGTQQAL